MNVENIRERENYLILLESNQLPIFYKKTALPSELKIEVTFSMTTTFQLNNQLHDINFYT